MGTLPSRREFREFARPGEWLPVAAKIPLEAEPTALFSAIGFAKPHLLLESARAHPVTGRYSLIVGEPADILFAKGDRVTFQRGNRQETFTANPLRFLERLLKERPAARLPGFPPFVGGAVGFLGFDAYRYVEEVTAHSRDDLGLPDVGFIFCDQAVVVDHLLGELWAIALAAPGGSPDRAYDEAVGKAEALLARATRSSDRHCEAQTSRHCEARRAEAISEIASSSVTNHGGLLAMTNMHSTHTQADFEKMVRRAKAFIAKGEIYQANLSQRFAAPLATSPWELYERLRSINPSPFAAFADYGFLQIISASPERFLRVREGTVETRPIAGTRPRGETLEETRELRRELLLNEKEQAEHLMLVDLERNDLGRISRYGTVEVDTFMDVEEYSHVIHIISNVRGSLRPGVGFSDLMAATFPGGTITGCPKVRCLEILEMLEPVRRQLYTGSLGYVSYSGEIDFNLLIRTAFVKSQTVYLHVGAGIVADSDPAREYEETLHKAKALFLALHAESDSKATLAVPARIL